MGNTGKLSGWGSLTERGTQSFSPEEVGAVERDLFFFLKSLEGQVICMFLKKTDQTINLGADPIGGHTTGYFLSGDGLVKRWESSGLYLISPPKNMPKVIVEPISAKEAVDAFIRFGHRDPKTIVSWIEVSYRNIL